MQPYAGMSNVETSEYVLQGKRLAQPERCPERVYEAMLECWAEKTKDRPTMVDVHGKLQGALLRLGSKPSEMPQVEQASDIYNN